MLFSSSCTRSCVMYRPSVCSCLPIALPVSAEYHVALVIVVLVASDPDSSHDLQLLLVHTRIDLPGDSIRMRFALRFFASILTPSSDDSAPCEVPSSFDWLATSVFVRLSIYSIPFGLFFARSVETSAVP